METRGHQQRMAARRWGPLESPAYPPTASKKQSGRFLAFLRHPLFHLVLSSVLIASVGKFYADYSAAVRARSETRTGIVDLLTELRLREVSAQSATKRLFDLERDPCTYVDATLKVERDRLRQSQPPILARVMEGRDSVSGPQFKNVHIIALVSRLEIASGLPPFADDFNDYGHDADDRLHILGAVREMSEAVNSMPLREAAMQTFEIYLNTRERNLLENVIPVKHGSFLGWPSDEPFGNGEPPPTTDYLTEVGGVIERSTAARSGLVTTKCNKPS